MPEPESLFVLQGDNWDIAYTAQPAAGAIASGCPSRQAVDGLFASVTSGLVDSGIQAPSEYTPSLVYNDRREGVSVLSRLMDEFRRLGPGDEFWIVVAFVKHSGLQLLIQTLDEMVRRGVRGRILTGTYLTFSEPRAFRTLLRYACSGIETRVYNAEYGGLHAKSYFFIAGDLTTMITGSSNLTDSALKGNMEWNVALSSARHGALIKEAREAYERLWSSPETYKLDEPFIEAYEREYSRNAASRIIPVSATAQDRIIEPNRMQHDALNSLREIREQGEPRALVISATGTGKTYLSALDVRQMDPRPRRVLFLVHRERIAHASLASYRRVLGDAYSYGLFGGGRHDTEATCLFSTVQTMARLDNLARFAPDAFDYIVIDEVHRAGAKSYQDIIGHFTPKFLLGMSATPERSDGFDVFALFNHVVAHEIRLSDALDNHLVTPFHYFGVSESSRAAADPAGLATGIIEQAEKYGFSGPRVKGLVFCSTVEESAGVADMMCEKGFRAVSLSGTSSDKDRESAMQRLEADEGDDVLDYIVTVDIFNEGVDIPTVNQVILARPTQSAIVFVQQLGRGLRTNPEKEFVTVIDFVGNYERNYNIPVALYGERSFEKERLRRLVADGGDTVAGTTVIQFDEIARERVLESVNSATFNSIRFVREGYRALRRRLGRIPTLEEFRRLGEMSPSLIFQCSSLGSYHAFLDKYEPGYSSDIGERGASFLRFISMKLSDGKRASELLILEDLLSGPVDMNRCVDRLEASDLLNGHKFNKDQLTADILSSWRLLSLDFYTKVVTSKFEPLARIEGNRLVPSDSFARCCTSSDFIGQIRQVVEYGLGAYHDDYAGGRESGSRLKIGKRYTREDACRLLNWADNEYATINGYAFKTSDWVIFVTYDKSGDVSDTVRYEDRFISPRSFLWYSTGNRGLGSKDYKKLAAFDPATQRIHLFVKRDDNDGADHYYLGTLGFDVASIVEERRRLANGSTQPILRVPFTLDDEVPKDVYRYIAG